MIAQDFARLRVLATASIARLWWREHVRADGQKTSEGAASAVCTLQIPVDDTEDESDPMEIANSMSGLVQYAG